MKRPTVDFKSKSTVLFTLLGFVVAPLVPAFGITSLSPLTTDLTSLLLGITLFYVWSLGLSIWIALPLYSLLQRFSLVRWWSASLGGLAIGEGIAIFLLKNMEPMGYLSFGAFGCAAGFIFWAIWRIGQNAPQLDDSSHRQTEAPPLLNGP